MADQVPNRGYIATVLSCRCPRCREGKLFRYPLTFNFNKNTIMHERCPVCEQLTDIEVGFYYGTGFVSYLIAVAISAFTFLIWWPIIGFSFGDHRFFWWLGLNALLLILLQPWLMRLSRSLWISWFVKYDPNWKHNKPDDHERRIDGQMNNW